MKRAGLNHRNENQKICYSRFSQLSLFMSIEWEYNDYRTVEARKHGTIRNRLPVNLSYNEAVGVVHPGRISLLR